ncbi:MAG: hypothetical protein WAZ12_01185 [Candidatus Absconditicoccaceae bacterium]
MKKKVNRTKWGAIFAGVTIIFTVIGRNSTQSKEEKNINQFQNNPFNSPQVANSPGTVINYTDTKDPNYLNPRSEFLKGLQPIDLSKQILELQNQSKFRDACSILPKKKGDKGCNAIDGNDISLFSRAVKSYQMGYENIEVQLLEDKSTDYKQIVCVKYSYVLKSDSNPSRIREKYAFYFDKREDGEWELTSRTCESKYKEGLGARPCGYQYNEAKVCEGILE